MAIASYFSEIQQSMRNWTKKTDLTGPEIANQVCKKGNHGLEGKETSILASDFCYNRWNKQFAGKPEYEFAESRLFICHPENKRSYRYDFVDVNHGYTGDIVHSRTGKVVGRWENGQLVHYEVNPELD